MRRNKPGRYSDLWRKRAKDRKRTKVTFTFFIVTRAKNILFRFVFSRLTFQNLLSFTNNSIEIPHSGILDIALYISCTTDEVILLQFLLWLSVTHVTDRQTYANISLQLSRVITMPQCKEIPWTSRGAWLGQTHHFLFVKSSCALAQFHTTTPVPSASFTHSLPA